MAKTRRPITQKGSAVVYQLKITLVGSAPPIWRRIQLTDGTLDDLHACIQMAMGWTNSHLHEFEIDGIRYGDPEQLDGGFGEFDGENSKKTRLSTILARRKMGFRFRYTYDFGDDWVHEIRFEQALPAEPKGKYPRCTEGKQACPPEDVGGVWGYAHLLEVLADPKDAEYEDMVEWAGDVEENEFSAEKTTKRMRKGLPGWG